MPFIDWSSLTETCATVDEACSYIYQNLYKLFDEYVSKRSARCNSFPVWFTSSIIEKINKKRRIWKLYKLHKYEMDRHQMNCLRKSIKSEIKNEYANFLQKAQVDINHNPNNLWRYINLKKNVTSVPREMNLRDRKASTAQEVVSYFAEHFSFVYDSDCNTTGARACNDISDNLNVFHRF